MDIHIGYIYRDYSLVLGRTTLRGSKASPSSPQEYRAPGGSQLSAGCDVAGRQTWPCHGGQTI